MGMMYLAALAAAKKQQDRRHAAARRERARREKAEREANEKRNSSYGSYSEDVPSYFECIGQEIDIDPELKEFFQKLYQKIQQIRDEAGAEYRAKAEELRDLAEKYNAEKIKIEERLEASGIKFGERRQLGGIYLGRFTAEYQSSTWDKSRLSLYREKGDSYIYYQAETVNGIERYRITDSLINDEMPETRLNIAKEAFASNKKELEAAKKELKKLEKRKLFISYEKKENRLIQLRNKIRELENNIDKNRRAIREYEFVLGLTDEQKADFIKYIEAERCISDITYETRKLEGKFNAALPDIDNKDTIIQAMQLLEQDGLTEEEITKIFKKLDKVAILRSRDEYKHKAWYSEYTPDARIIRAFVKEIYESDPDFVDRNMPQIVSLDKGDKEVDGEEQDVSDDSDDPEL